MSPRVFSIHYDLFDPAGVLMQSTRGKQAVNFVEGSGKILPELEAAIRTMKAGERREIFVPSDHLFGPREEGRVLKVPRDQVPKSNAQVGQQLTWAEDPSAPPATVIDVTGAYYIVDTNHPYAGMDLRFEV